MTTTPKPNAAERLRAEADFVAGGGVPAPIAARYRLLADLLDEITLHQGLNCAACADLLARAEEELP